jgi:hypothetical protein
MAVQMRRGNLADFDPTKMMPGEFAVTLDKDNNLNKRVFITFAAGTVKQLMTVEDATAQMIEATDAATAEAEAWAHGNSFTATEMFTSAGSTTVTLAYSPSSIVAVKINDVVTTAYTRNDKVITFNTAPAVGSTITVIYGVSTATDNAKYYKEQAANSASTASTKAAEAGTSATNAANSATTAGTKATEAGNNATLAESYAVGGTGTRPGEDSDNAEYYYEQARDISQSLTGALKPCGTVTYVNLPSLSVALVGDMYNVSDEFTTTNDFKEGAGHHINAGANVYKTIDNKWDILAGVTVTGVKGNKEQNYRQGNVNLTPANIGAVPEPSTEGSNGQVLATDGQGGRSWQSVQSSLTFDNVPTQNSNNPVKSGGIFSTMAVPKYDATNRREYYEGGSAFSGNIDSTPTEGSNNAVASGGVWSAIDNIPKMHIVHFEVAISDLTAWGSVYEKGFNIDISSLQLTNQPRFISAELLNPDMGGWLRGFTINNANTSIGAVFTRPTVASGNIRGNVLIIE